MTDDADTLLRLERSLWDVILGFSRRDIAADIARHAGHELPPASWALLEYLDRFGAMRVSDIASCHGVDVSSVTPRLQALENEGLVERCPAPLDRRASVIAIGAAGRAALARIHGARSAMLADVLGDANREDVETATALLARVAKWLQPEAVRESQPGAAS